VAPMILQKGDSYPKAGTPGGRQRLILGWARGGSGQLEFQYTQDVTPISSNAVLDPTVVRKVGPPARN